MAPIHPKDAGKPATLGDVARAAGVSRSAASYALRNRPEVSEATRKRLQAIAVKLGYKPDARMDSQMARLRAAKSRELVPIAWINTGYSRDVWQRLSYLKPYLDGARERCAALGYRLDEFWLREPGMTEDRISKILFSRGIHGVILAPPEKNDHIQVELKWEWFGCVSFEKAIIAPGLIHIVQDRYNNMLLCLQRVQRFGCKRIAVLVEQQSDRRSNHAIEAAVLYFKNHARSVEVLPLMFSGPHGIPKNFSTWLGRHRPDVIIAQNNHLVEAVEATGRSVPKDIGIVHAALDGDCEDWTGVWARKSEIGTAVAEAAISLIQNHRYGLPTAPRDILIQGRWQPGRTLLDKSKR